MNTTTTSPFNPEDDNNEETTLLNASQTEAKSQEDAVRTDGATGVDFDEIALLPEGPCRFKIEDAEILMQVQTPYGLKNKVRFGFTVAQTDEETGETETGTIHRSYNISKYEKSELMQFTAQLGLPKPGKRFDPSVYVGLSGEAVVKHAEAYSGDEIAVLDCFKVTSR
jgi:hypothetical protein